jgi:iron complex transport system permease protein
MPTSSSASTDPHAFSPGGVDAKSAANLGAFSGAYLTRTRMLAIIISMAGALIVAILVAVQFGAVKIDVSLAIRDASSPDHAILFSARLPRVLMGAIVGAVLAAVGAALQALVRNPLAEGGILGISGGGALGAILALVFGYRLGGAAFLVPSAAFGAALLSTILVYKLGQVEGRLEPFTLLLVGVIFNAFWGAMILLVNSLVNFYQAHSIISWLLGSLEAPTYSEVAMVTVMGLVGFTTLYLRARDMNLLSLGDEAAADLGVDVERSRRIIFLATSIMIGAAVSVSGMIGFVGLIMPHILRLALGADHRLLLPTSLIGGAIFLVLADLLARTIIAPAEIPVGVITALCGGPFFIYLLRREGKKAIAE